MKDQKTPEEILEKHHLLVISDTEGFLHALKDDIVSAMQEYAQTISEGKDREIEELREALGYAKQILDYIGVEDNHIEREPGDYYTLRETHPKEVDFIYAALNKVH